MFFGSSNNLSLEGCQVLQTDAFCNAFIIEMSADHVGKEICVITDDGRFYGTIHSVDGKHGKLILQKGL